MFKVLIVTLLCTSCLLAKHVDFKNMVSMTQVNAKVLQPDDQAAQEECITVFSECEYKGNSAEICQDNNNLLDNVGFKIKSVRVPKGYEITIYDETDYGGKQVVITEDHECFVHEEFTFLSIKLQSNFNKGHLKRNKY